METLVYVIIFVLPSVLIGVAVGVYLGRSHFGHEKAEAEKEREKVLGSLITMLSSAEQLTSDVGRHNTEMEEVSRDIQQLHLSGELENVQHALLQQIADVVQCNQRLEEDLTYARFRMEEQAQEIDRTRREARTDALSGVANRKDFDERLHYLMTVFKRESTPFVLVLADVDHFKWINDTHGHQAGDRVVSHVGSFLRQIIRTGDHVARFGGDEFALLLPRTDLATGAHIAEQVRVELARMNFDVGDNGQRVAATFSIGVASVRVGDTAEDVFARADSALYRSKEGGRNQTNAAEDSPEPALAG